MAELKRITLTEFMARQERITELIHKRLLFAGKTGTGIVWSAPTAHAHAGNGIKGPAIDLWVGNRRYTLGGEEFARSNIDLANTIAKFERETAPGVYHDFRVWRLHYEELLTVAMKRRTDTVAVPF
jgi:hypothetical protein